jgi:hypothetical protein
MTIVYIVAVAILVESAIGIVLRFRGHQQRKRIMSQLDDLAAQVSKNVHTEGAAAALLDTLAANGDASRLTSLTASLKTADDALTAKVAAHTPPPTP